jgi:hypothetical protein
VEPVESVEPSFRDPLLFPLSVSSSFSFTSYHLHFHNQIQYLATQEFLQLILTRE